MNLRELGADTAVDLGLQLRQLVRSSRGAEAAAGAMAQHLHRTLTTAEGERACVLVRLYTTAPFSSLNPGQADFARDAMGNEPDPGMVCFTLLGSAGDEAEWNDPALSRGHRAIPLPSREGVARLPMVAQLFRELGLDIGAFLERDRKLMVDIATSSYNVFYVAEAAGSPHVPAQADFVERYGIRSVIGFGGVLPTQELYAVIMFTRVHVPRRNAAMFRVVALSVKEALEPHLA